MKPNPSPLRLWAPSICAFLFLAAATFSAGCKQRAVGTAGVITYKMGERVSVGRVTYNVLEAEWKTALGSGTSARVPQHRFVVVRVTITNSAPTEVGIPLLSLYDPTGKVYRELEDGDQVPGWLGLFRLLRPVQTETGTLLFDAPPGEYKLQVTDGGEVGSEIIAYVNIPVNLEVDPVLAEPPSIEKK